MISEALELNQINHISFVMVDVTLTEVAGLGNAFTLWVSKNGGGFAASTGVKSEISNGWYHYILPAAECDTVGTLEIRVTGAGCIQQNLEYVVKARNSGCISFTYTVTDTVTLLPVADCVVWFTTDLAGMNVVWSGTTDAFGVARDTFGQVPCLDAGTYRVWKSKVGYIPDFWPDTEVVS